MSAGRVIIESKDTTTRSVHFAPKAGIKVCYNRYSWGTGKQGSEYISWFRRFECISRMFLTVSRILKSLYHLRSCRNSSEYSIKSNGSKIGPPPPGGLQKNREKMCKTFARHCMGWKSILGHKFKTDLYGGQNGWRAIFFL